ncbi:hypothetical protein ELI_2018 [Eubacterium callanderi]|uniref:Uncharacterized protein n=1 Tax=Eubacterium callanderi TaxID=53442 RepID=E3GDS1_9FIRM|nr:hypothetical protein ELI_2018 [Eubacterium callanderi]
MPAVAITSKTLITMVPMKQAKKEGKNLDEVIEEELEEQNE